MTSSFPISRAATTTTARAANSGGINPWDVTTTLEGDILKTTYKYLGRTTEVFTFNLSELMRLAAEQQAVTEAQPATPAIFAGPLEALRIGDPIQEVFCRRRTGGTGGVLVRGKATEARFTNDENTMTVQWHLVLSAGKISPIQERDVRNGQYRQGTFSQNWNQRAGLFTPGNLAVPQAGYDLPDFPQACGGGGDYIGLSTMAVSNTYPGGSDRWKDNWNFFARGGIEVTRIFDNVVGPSDNLVDYIIRRAIRTGRIRSDMIDMTTMLQTAKFLEANQLYCNAVFDMTQSFEDFLTNILPAFLLRVTKISGKFAVVPTVPINIDGTINTNPLDPLLLEERIVDVSSFVHSPLPADARMPIRVMVLWRQQTSDVEPPLARNTMIGYLRDGDPTETYDLSAVCTSEIHAATAGAYRFAIRSLSEGPATVRLIAGPQTGRIAQGDIIQIRLVLATEEEPPGFLNRFWTVTDITLSRDGSETLALEDCPVDSSGRSLVAQQVVAARNGIKNIILPYPPSGAGDAPGRATSTTVPASTTSGVPFSQGGSGIAGTFTGGSNSRASGGSVAGGGGGSGGGGFDEVRLPDPPPAAPPVRISEGSPVAGDPVVPSAPIVVSVPPNPGVWITSGARSGWATDRCKYGYAILSYNIIIPELGAFAADMQADEDHPNGYALGAGQQGDNRSGITLLQPPQVDHVGTGTITYGSNDPSIGDLTGQVIKVYKISISEPTGASIITAYEVASVGLIQVEELSFRCQLRDGTAGPQNEQGPFD